MSAPWPPPACVSERQSPESKHPVYWRGPVNSPWSPPIYEWQSRWARVERRIESNPGRHAATGLAKTVFGQSLLNAVRARDGDLCRLCGIPVSWAARKGQHAASYELLRPADGLTIENIVVCCRYCRSVVKGRPVSEAAITPLPPPPMARGAA
jgi:hypothetical protein